MKRRPQTVEEQLRALGVDPSRVTVGPAPAAVATAPGLPSVARKAPPRPNGMNKTEAAYAWDLELLQRAGEITRWRFEGITLRLDDPTDGKRGIRYTPDFNLWLPGGGLRLIEIKGFLREDAKLKFLWARQQYPEWDFQMLRREGGQWVRLF